MPRLILKINHQQNMLFEITGPQVLIGRGEHTDLVLPNVSVSREHARITRDPESGVYRIEDADSQNGLVVNDETTTGHELSSGDVIQIGRFSLIFLSDRPEDRFYRGRAVSYIPRYDKASISTRSEQSTHQLTPEIAARLKRDNQLLHSACVTMDGTGLYWYPEGHPLTFGDARASVLVDGFLVRGTVATITWDGRAHKLQRSAAMVSATHNGRKLRNKEEAALRPGDQFEVGGVGFKYEIRLS